MLTNSFSKSVLRHLPRLSEHLVGVAAMLALVRGKLNRGLGPRVITELAESYTRVT